MANTIRRVALENHKRLRLRPFSLLAISASLVLTSCSSSEEPPKTFEFDPNVTAQDVWIINDFVNAQNCQSVLYLDDDIYSMPHMKAVACATTSGFTSLRAFESRNAMFRGLDTVLPTLQDIDVVVGGDLWFAVIPRNDAHIATSLTQDAFQMTAEEIVTGIQNSSASKTEQDLDFCVSWAATLIENHFLPEEQLLSPEDTAREYPGMEKVVDKIFGKFNEHELSEIKSTLQNDFGTYLSHISSKFEPVKVFCRKHG